MSWSTAIAKPPIFYGEDERALKLEYAALIVAHSGNAAEAAYALFPGEQNYGRAWACAEHWPHDPIVVFEVARISVDPEVTSYLATKDMLAKELWDESRRTPDPKTKLDYLKEYGEVMGFKPKQGNNVQVNLTQNVIEVPTRASEAELPALEGQWAEQQRQLIADARSSRPK